jgi:hypothetical protein
MHPLCTLLEAKLFVKLTVHVCSWHAAAAQAHACTQECDVPLLLFLPSAAAADAAAAAAAALQALAAAREEEFERWKGHLEGVEVALQAAQQESLTYR